MTKYHKTQNTKNHKRRRAWRFCRGEAAMYRPRAGLAYCVFLHSSSDRCVWKVCVWPGYCLWGLEREKCVRILWLVIESNWVFFVKYCGEIMGVFCAYLCLVFLCIVWLGCIQHWWYSVSSSLVCIWTLSLDAGYTFLSLQPPQSITRSHTDLPHTATQWWMKTHAISQTRTRTLHSNIPTIEPPGSPPFVIFCVLWFFVPGFVLFRFICFLIFLGPVFFWFLVSSACWYYQSIHLCIIKQFTHTLNTDTLYSNKGLDVESSLSNKPSHNYMNNLKCVEWQRTDDDHYRPKHVVFGSRI